MRIARRSVCLSLLTLCLVTIFGCGNGKSGGGNGGTVKSGRQELLSMGTAPVGDAFPVVGGAITEVLNDHQGTINWKINAKGTKGSQENIRLLEKEKLELALSNAAITYFAVRGEGTWNKKYEMRAIATMAPNVAMFVTRTDSGIKRIADLKGKRVIVGPSGAGFEMFVRPLVEAHGVAWDSFTQLNATQGAAVDQLGDGSADAAFLGGAVPTASIAQASTTFDVFLVPFDEPIRQKLIEDFAFFHPAKVPAGTYKGLEEDYQGLNVGSMHVITSASQDEDLIYELTKAIWENRADIAERHPAGKALNEKNVARDTGTEYHPGAIRFYQEAGVWPGLNGESTETYGGATDAPPEPAAKDAPPEPAAKDAPPEPAAKDAPPEPAAKDAPPEPAAKDAPPEPAAKDAPPEPAAKDAAPEPTAKE